MITSRKLEIYREYDGMADLWVNMGKRKSTEISENDFYEIMNLLQVATLLKRNLATPDLSEQIRRRLSEATDSHETLQVLLEMA
jgi:hypothetical protein